MIDLHCHLLPGVDDGAADLPEAVAMLRQAEADGITTIVVTPHALSSQSPSRDLDELRRSWGKWLPELQRSCPAVELKTGAEVFFTSGLPALLKEHRDLLTINSGSYFLLEFPADYVYSNSRDFIFSVMSDGFIPIISHAERNSEIQRSPEILFALVKAGALCQINAGSLRGDFGATARQTAFELLDGNWVHVIASDGHDPRGRRPELSFVPGLLRHEAAARADLYLRDIPAAIIADQAPPDIGEPVSRQRQRRFFDFFKKEPE